MSNSFSRLTRTERFILIGSLTAILCSFLISGQDLLSLAASCVGAAALIFVARGEVIGQLLTVLFSLLYALISWELRYYGEMITYVGMSAPIALLTAISWHNHPYEKGKSQVKVSRLTPRLAVVMVLSAAVVTVIFYFILRSLGNASLTVSTISVTTSFLACFLLYARCPAYALAYGANDVVLIILWIIASLSDLSNLPMVICFVIFLVNDLYGFINWTRMRRRQSTNG